ncbi:MAG TPA: hypothetical protein VGS80_06275 [Ktedonobacterales bacterium]|nr:hypothetical protein [Ktedonobacterales bacterium]
MSQTLRPDWIAQLDELLALLDSPQPGHEAAVLDRAVAMDPDLLAFIVGQLGEQASPEAAAFLELLAAHPQTPEAVRATARQGRDALAERGVTPAMAGEERYLTGYIQQNRHRGEQIMLLGWRLPSGGVEALVFLLDWRGDGLKDFYRTRPMTDAEWHELLAHNAAKGAPLVEILLPQARILLESALAEGRRFGRAVPREYKIEGRVVARRVLSAEPAPALPSGIPPDLGPDEVVAAYIAALHFRDYALAALLLAPDHPLRAGRTVVETSAELRVQGKGAPRREAAAQVTARILVREGDVTARVQAFGAEVTVEPTGRRLRHDMREEYTVQRVADGWRIALSESL